MRTATHGAVVANDHSDVVPPVTRYYRCIEKNGTRQVIQVGYLENIFGDIALGRAELIVMTNQGVFERTLYVINPGSKRVSEVRVDET